MKKRVLAWALLLCMLAALFPAAAFAEDPVIPSGSEEAPDDFLFVPVDEGEAVILSGDEAGNTLRSSQTLSFDEEGELWFVETVGDNEGYRLLAPEIDGYTIQEIRVADGQGFTTTVTPTWGLWIGGWNERFGEWDVYWGGPASAQHDWEGVSARGALVCTYVYSENTGADGIVLTAQYRSTSGEVIREDGPLAFGDDGWDLPPVIEGYGYSRTDIVSGLPIFHWGGASGYGIYRYMDPETEELSYYATPAKGGQQPLEDLRLLTEDGVLAYVYYRSVAPSSLPIAHFVDEAGETIAPDQQLGTDVTLAAENEAGGYTLIAPEIDGYTIRLIRLTDKGSGNDPIELRGESALRFWWNDAGGWDFELRDPSCGGFGALSDPDVTYVYAGSAAQGGWRQVDGKRYYYENGEALRGWQQIDGKWYHFDGSGVMDSGWLKSGGSWYYLGTDGVMQTGWVNDGGKKYYMDESGAMQTGWKQLGGVWYYFQSGGAAATGWEKLDGTWYYFDAEGKMATGLREIGGKKYFFASSGAMQTGWKQIGGTWYYFQSGGAAATGWLQLGGTWYYFDAEGKMATGLREIGGKKYYFASSGAMQTGWKQIGGAWYYFRSGGAAATGWEKVGGTWYYFDTGCKMVTGWQTIDGKKYLFASSGAMQTGWKQIDGAWYYFGSGGAMATGWEQVGGTWYYLDAEGRMVTGWQTINEKKYYFSSSGAMKTGWLKDANAWYYFNSSGSMVTGWEKVSGSWYYFLSSGVMVTGHRTIGGREYIFSGSGALTGSEKVSDLPTVRYVLNTASGKFHYANCKDVSKMLSSNTMYFCGTRSEAIAMGYSPCGHCDP